MNKGSIFGNNAGGGGGLNSSNNNMNNNNAISGGGIGGLSGGINNANQQIGSISSAGGISLGQREILQHIERLIDTSKEMLVIPIEQYSQLISIHGKEDIILTLPASGLFSEDIRIMITNGKLAYLMREK